MSNVEGMYSIYFINKRINSPKKGIIPVVFLRLRRIKPTYERVHVQIGSTLPLYWLYFRNKITERSDTILRHSTFCGSAVRFLTLCSFL
jgi:Gpi18-like mannosyltransferase